MNKRKRKIQAGESICLYLPQSIEPELLEWINNQKSLTKGFLGVLRQHIKGHEKRIKTSETNQVSLDTDMINAIAEQVLKIQQCNRTTESKPRDSSQDTTTNQKVPKIEPILEPIKRTIEVEEKLKPIKDESMPQERNITTTEEKSQVTNKTNIKRKRINFVDSMHK